MFWMRDKCGDDCLYTPSSPRETHANSGLYKYRMAMMAEIVPSKLMTFSLLPANLITGTDFGCTSLLYTISDLMDAGIWTDRTTTSIFNSDGGPENVGYVQHATAFQLLKTKVVRKKIIFARLPPDHHHNFVDATFGVAETHLRAPGFQGCRLCNTVGFATGVAATFLRTNIRI